MFIEVELIDHQNHQIVYKGKANMELTHQGHHYRFGNQDHSFFWKAYDGALIIDSVGTSHAHLILQKGKKTKGWFKTEFGEINLHCHTSLYTIDNHCIEVRYTLDMEGHIQTFHFTLRIKEADYAVH